MTYPPPPTRDAYYHAVLLFGFVRSDGLFLSGSSHPCTVYSIRTLCTVTTRHDLPCHERHDMTRAAALARAASSRARPVPSLSRRLQVAETLCGFHICGFGAIHRGSCRTQENGPHRRRSSSRRVGGWLYMVRSLLLSGLGSVWYGLRVCARLYLSVCAHPHHRRRLPLFPMSMLRVYVVSHALRYLPRLAPSPHPCSSFPSPRADPASLLQFLARSPLSSALALSVLHRPLRWYRSSVVNR